MHGIEIKKVSDDELDRLREISIKTFAASFAEANTPENMQSYLDENFSGEQLKKELFNPYSDFYFATFKQKIIGYLKINTGQAQTELKNQNSLEIERIYVLKEFQGKKVGQALFDSALRTARTKKCNMIWLGVWEKNEGAIRFYLKNRMIEFDRHTFKLGNDVQTDLMLKRDL